MNALEQKLFLTAEDLFNHVAPWGADPGLKGYVFRGHSQESYQLIPSALRVESRDLLWTASGFPKPDSSLIETIFMQVQAEFQSLRNFYRLADQRGLAVPLSPRVREGLVAENASLISFRATALDRWIPTDLHEAAALAQHYGVPTSLLDWTYDIFVAMYFAFTGAIGKQGNICIWAINKEHISWMAPMVGSYEVDFVTPHYAGNPHLNAQKGLFTHLPGPMPTFAAVEADVKNVAVFEQEVDRRSLDVVLYERIDKSEENLFKKYLLPCSEAEKGCQILEKLGYDASRIFPGYGGVAIQLLTRHRYL